LSFVEKYANLVV